MDVYFLQPFLLLPHLPSPSPLLLLHSSPPSISSLRGSRLLHPGAMPPCCRCSRFRHRGLCRHYLQAACSSGREWGGEERISVYRSIYLSIDLNSSSFLSRPRPSLYLPRLTDVCRWVGRCTYNSMCTNPPNPYSQRADCMYRAIQLSGR